MVIAPVFVVNIAWLLMAVYYSRSHEIFDDLTHETVMVCLTAILFYNVGLFFSEVVLSGSLIKPKYKKKEPSIAQPDLISNTLELILLIIWLSLLTVIIGTNYYPGMAPGQLRQLFLDSWYERNLITIAFALAVNGLTFFYTYKVALSFKNRRGVSSRDVFLLLLVLIFSFSRTLILISCCTLVAAGVIWRGWAIRQLSVFIISFIFIFIVLALVTGKDPNQSEHGVAESASLSLQVYFFGGVSGFNQAIATGFPHYDAYLTLPRMIYSILHPFMSVAVEQAPSYYDFVQTPFPLNIYTFLYPPYHDFGFAGIILFPFVYGIMHQMTFIKARLSRDLVSAYVLGFFTYAALMSVFDDQYIRGLPVFLIGLFTFLTLDKAVFIRKRLLSATHAGTDADSHRMPIRLLILNQRTQNITN